MDARDAYLSRVLDAIEQQEARLLVWGVVDGWFKQEELALLIDAQIERELGLGNEEFLDSQEVIDALRDRGLILAVHNGPAISGFRSRMAETTRLLLRLRQLFPKHATRPAGWQGAATLVADFRFQRRRRQYPRREVAGTEAVDHLAGTDNDVSLLAGIRAIVQPLHRDLKLAKFQLRAAERILYSIKTGKPLGTIVCAGTGSGKTLAFYLPALASIVRHRLSHPADADWVKAVALYPRTELLKDQVREVLSRVIDLRSRLVGDASRKIRIGALFGDTPISAEKCDWKMVGGDRICPILRCINCNGELRWGSADYRAGVERLRCRDCDFTCDDSVFPLTRESLQRMPPDVLFSTTEMLNQRLADSSLQHLFGIGVDALRAPELVLVDEVHTYEGRHGAQVAYLLRRWQHLLEQPLRFVGLSATLRDPEGFFSTLTGMRQGNVRAVSPRLDEIDSEGAEYLIALRGDPVSRAALLSTSIQTSMLIQRCLDPKATGDSLSLGFFGQRTFVFTDDLDVTNRLYFDLLNAEGRTSRGNPDLQRAPAGGLAVLRRSGSSLARYRGGQDWRACEDLGHQLATRLVVDRVSSQDRGVDVSADIVVATAALEVGFDDPLVGAVVQHKAPRSAAGFLQRRGRGGRTRGMRPWTLVVLSDYGRDRVAYQAYDQLFDPELSLRTLPLTNRYVKRMQAVFALIDFLGNRLRDVAPGSMWRNLVGPVTHDRRRENIAKELRTLLESERATERFAQFLSSALNLPSEEIRSLLWEFPRPLMTVVIPTALRRIASSWRAYGRQAEDLQIRNNPLPEFIPGKLFADLNLAEVNIQFPQQPSGDVQDDAAMPVVAVLREFAPGRVSRRFGTRFRTERYWISPGAPTSPGAVNAVNIDTFCSHSLIGEFQQWHVGEVRPIRVYRPSNLTPTVPASNVADSSHARLLWCSQLVPLGEPVWLAPPADTVWNDVVNRIGFFTHAAQAPVEVRRFATGSEAEVGLGHNNRRQVRVEFEHEGVPAALGIAFAADAVVVELRTPQALHAKAVGDQKWRALRTARFLDRAWRGDVLSAVTSPFVREWLAHIFLSAITHEAVRNHSDLETAAASIVNGTSSIALRDVLSVLFQSHSIESDGQQVDLGGDERLRHELDDLLSRADIVSDLCRAAEVLWQPISAEWEPWLRGVYQSTIAAGVLRAIGDLCPTVDIDDLIAEISRGPSPATVFSAQAPDTLEVWISEKGPGGNGHIEEFMRSYAEDPRRFFGLVRTALEVSEFELIDHQLARLLDVLLDGGSPSRVQTVVQRFRSSTTHSEMVALSRELRKALVQEGFSAFHGFLVSMGTRILRPGTGTATDRYLANALRQWNLEERRLGVEIDIRVMCYCLSQSPDIDEIASEVGIGPKQDLSAWRMSAISGLLWARGQSVRHSALRLYNSFIDLPHLERLLVIDSLRDERLSISVHDDEWFSRVADLLAAGRLVTLTCSEHARSQLGSALSTLITNPIDAGYLRAYARLQGVRQTGEMIEADIELVEAAE